MNYKLIDRTPEELSCGTGACPAIYDLTPEEMNCGVGFCPRIYNSKENYLIIGTKVNPADFGLEKKVGENEVLIEVPKKLIDKMKK